MALEESGMIIKLEAAAAKFEKDMNRALKSHQRFTDRLDRQARQSADRMSKAYDRVPQGIAASFGKLKGLAMPFAGGFLGGLAAGGVAGIVNNVSRVTREVANLGNEAKRAGVSVEAFQEWKFVAEQNRIGIDAMTDGLKELHIRAGEFLLDDTGAGAAAFKKLGYSAEELKRKLEKPTDLMIEIMDRLRNFDQAGRSFLLEEIFGGAGGEQFSALIGQGEAALRETIQRAHETGAVLDAELIDKAAEIDRRFHELSVSVGNFGKKVVVEIAAAGIELADFRARLDDIFSDEATGRAILGNEVYDALAASRDMVDENTEALHRLDERYSHLAEEADAAGFAMRNAISTLDSWGYDEAADSMLTLSAELDSVTQSFRDGDTSGEDFAKRLAEIEAAASDAFGVLEEGDKVQFQNVTSQLSRLGGVIAAVTSLANSLTGALATAAGIDPDQKRLAALRARQEAEAASLDSLDRMNAANAEFAASEAARNEASTEQLRLQREIEAVRKRAGEAGATLTAAEAEAAARAALAADAARQAADKAGRGGAGGGGGASRVAKVDEFTGEAQAIRERTAALQIEAATLLTVAQSRSVLSNATDFAKVKTDLLTAAQRAGVAITPELRAEIDRLAESYAAASAEAQRNADAVAEAADAQGRAAGRMTNLAMARIRDGKEGLARELQNMADEILGKMLTEIFSSFMSQAGQMAGAQAGGGGGGGGDALMMIAQLAMRLFGFERGGYTGDGGVSQVAGVVHGQEFVFSAPAVRAIGAGNLDQLHRAARNGYQDGGLVGHAGRLHQAVSGQQNAQQAAPAPVINIAGGPITVNGGGGTAEQNGDLARQIAAETEKSMRGLVRQELVNQLRPGGMLR